MNKLKKSLLFRTAVAMPFMWCGMTLPATCVTWWHGNGVYLVYIALFIFLTSIPFTLYSYKNFYIFNTLTALIAVLFNFTALVFLFFPENNGWGQWNNNGELIKVYITLSPNFSYGIIGLLALLFILFAVKKFFEIDYPKMKKEAFKDKVIDKAEHQVFLNKGLNMIVGLSFNVKILAKFEHWLYIIGFIILCAVVLPVKGLGSSMVAMGNNTFIASSFFILCYIFICVTYWIALTMYAQYCLINKIEKELGVKLRPAMKPS